MGNISVENEAKMYSLRLYMGKQFFFRVCYMPQLLEKIQERFREKWQMKKHLKKQSSKG